VKRMWLLSEKHWRKVQLGPLERMKEFARLGSEEGFEVHLAVPRIEAPPPPGIQLERLSPDLLDRIAPGEPVISSIFLPPRMLFSLLRSSIPFHADFYCVSALEGMESLQNLSPGRILRGRQRTVSRYGMLARRAERLYFSNGGQMEFVGGVLFASSGNPDPTEISRLPAKSIFAPMGIRGSAFPEGSPNPYPTELAGRPIFLWGGGIWQWFDVESLLRTFRLLQDADDPAALYFLVDRNPSEESSQDSAPAKAVQLAAELGLLNRNVFFHSRPVTPADLPGFLEHCAAGIMSNAPTLEAHASWRTRYLDLVWSGRPLLSNRSDLLSDWMSERNAALTSKDGSPESLADLIRRFCTDSDLSNELRLGAIGLRTSLSSDLRLAEIRKLLDRPFSNAGVRPSIRQILSYALGV